MDATQMMCDSLLESDEEEENANARAEPLATLRVFKNKHIPETVLPLYLGENVLGRDPSACTLPLHAQSVSKQHTAVSISVFHGGSQRGCASIEALVWDMGSMNGTRKGRLKLTPHVRYALSEGDNLMVADIPCQYTICGDTGGLVNIVSLVARESEGIREDVAVHTNGNGGEPTRASLGECGERMETPARTKGLSLEQTPTQPEGSLVPDSDSDGEHGGRDRRRKALVSVSESDSHVASPSCSTFLSPTNKIIPESEDESPITPSSSSKHRPTRCVSADSDEPDVGAWQQQLEDKKAALFIAADREEEERAAPVGTGPEERGGSAPVGTGPEERGGSAPDNPVNSVSTRATEELGQPGPVLSAELVQVLNMDSDTDVEGEEESAVSAGPVTPNRTLPAAPAPPPPPATAPTSQRGQFNMDSDTDVDDDDPTPGEVLAARQTDGDTAADGGGEPDGASKAPRASPQREDTPAPCGGPAQPSDFHLESDTDVEEDGDECEVEAGAPRNFDLGSDTDDEVLPADANGDPASEGVHAPLAPAADAGAHLDILSDSDTDAEEDSPLIPPAVAVATHCVPISSAPPSSSGPISLAAALGPDSDADTDVDETGASPAGAGMNGDFRMDSDTDMEDEEEAGTVGAEGGQVSCSSDEKDFGSIQGPRASLQQCSTPVASSGGAVAEMETQEYHSPSIDPFKCPRVPAPRLAVSPSSSGSLGEDDFVVAETQSFIVDDREQQTSPLGNFTLDETQPFAPQGTSKQGDDEDGTTAETSFQLGSSESIHLQLQQAQALATESTQAFVLSDGDVNLEATQAYSTSPSVEGSSLEPDSHLEAAQSNQGDAGSSRPSAVSEIKPQVDILLEGTQAYVVAAGTACALSSAETQPMAVSPVEESDDEDSAPAHRKRKARRLVEEEDTQSVTGLETAAAESQPRSSASSDESQEQGDKRPSLRGMRSRRQRNLEGATSTHATVAATEPVLGPKGQPRGGRGREPRPGTSRGCKKEEEEEKKEQEHPASVGSMRSKRKTRASTRGGAGVVGPEEEMESDQVMPGARRKTRENARERKERLEREAETERMRKEQEERERLERERLEMEEKERIGRERKEREEKERLERMQREKEEQGRLLCKKKERVERARLEMEEKERLERERQEREEEERLQKEEQERLERERKAREERLEKEERERTERQRQELEERERSEREQRKEEQERLERERKEEEQRAREEQQRLETEREEKETKGTTRGRRATRTAAPPAEPDPEKDCGPATRTRSRSNSSNSVSSERSASSSKAQESGVGGRGRGRGAKKSQPPAAAAGKPARDSRRRATVAGDESRPAGPGPGTCSRSNSNESLNSEASACSSAQSRGRGAGRGAGRGRGRKSLPAPETNSQPSRSSQNEKTPAPKDAARGRKTKRPVSPPGGGEDEPGCIQQPAATRGQRRSDAAHSVSMAVEEQEGTPEDSTLKVTSSTTGRGRGPKAQVKSEPVVTAVAVDGTDGVEHNDSGRAKGLAELESGRREEMPTPVQRGRRSMAQVRRNPNEHLVQEEMVKEEEEEETIERKVKRGRQSVAKKKKKEEEKELREEVAAAAASTTHAMEQDAGPSEVTRTPAGKSSRKRGAAAPAKASPVAKSPRAASAVSPGSRVRAAGQPCKVLFTGLVDEAGEKVVVRLGGSLALGVSDMTHLVTDKVRRTVKFLCAMARGIPVVTTQWLEKSAKAGTFLSPHAFIVKDKEQEKKFNFSLQESIRIASIQPLLQGYEIHVTKSVKPEPVHMSDIISCCGASFLAKMPCSHKERTVVVSCEEDRALCGPAVAACIPVVSAEFLLTGILQQRGDMEAHALPSAPAPTGPAPQAAGARGPGRKRT